MMPHVHNLLPSLTLILLITFDNVVLAQRKIWPHREFSSKYEDVHQDDVPSRPDGRIIFPLKVTDDDVQTTPTYNPICFHSTFCEDAFNYPDNAIDKALQMNKGLELFSTIDSIPDDVIHRFDESSDDNYSLCESYEKVIFPRVAKNKNKEWFFVVNQENFKQGVRVELCANENSACDLFDGFYEGYKTICKQKYVYRQLVAVSRTGRMKPEMFRFPSSCCCYVRFTGNPIMRMGSSKHQAPKSEI